MLIHRGFRTHESIFPHYVKSLHWFLQEQREEVASMTELLAVVERGKDNVLTVEENLSRAAGGANPLEAGAPPAAGGAL